MSNAVFTTSQKCVTIFLFIRTTSANNESISSVYCRQASISHKIFRLIFLNLFDYFISIWRVLAQIIKYKLQYLYLMPAKSVQSILFAAMWLLSYSHCKRIYFKSKPNIFFEFNFFSFLFKKKVLNETRIWKKCTQNQSTFSCYLFGETIFCFWNSKIISFFIKF